MKQYIQQLLCNVLLISVTLCSGCGSYRRWYNYNNEGHEDSMREKPYLSYRISGPDEENLVILSVNVNFDVSQFSDTTLKDILKRNYDIDIRGKLSKEELNHFYTKYFSFRARFVGDSVYFNKMYYFNSPKTIYIYAAHPVAKGFSFGDSVPDLEVEMKLRIGMKADGTDSVYVVRKVLKSNMRYREATIHG